ncbi:hypothetical protein RND81_13G028400 [Saponaria officinalis]|uniref:Uncharacterized protein n=1 Tax=Saponaria officinalis TaxID=3572 RepID=A0AAW1GTD4_SAPOF
MPRLHVIENLLSTGFQSVTLQKQPMKREKIESAEHSSETRSGDTKKQLCLSWFTSDCEKLLKMSALDLFRIKHTDNLQAFEVIHALLRNTYVLIEIRPQKALSINVLHWVLKKIIVDDEEFGSKSEVKPNSPTHKETDVKGLTTPTVGVDKPQTTASPRTGKTPQENPIFANKLVDPAEVKISDNLKAATDEA